MIVIKVELHSAITGKVTELGKMHISNDGTGSNTVGNYDGVVLRKPDFIIGTRRGKVEGHKRQAEVIWVLIAKMLKSMGYVK